MLTKINFRLAVCLLFILSNLQTSKSQAPWTRDTTFIFKNVIDSSISYLTNLKSSDSLLYKKHRKEFTNWEFFHGSRLGPNGTYGDFNQSLMNRVFPGGSTSTVNTLTITGENFSNNNCIQPCSTGCYGRGKWRSHGPFVPINTDQGNHSGVCTRVEQSPYNSNRLYVASVSGGMFKTTDGGQNWTSLDFVSSNGENAGTLGTSDFVVWHKSNMANDIIVASTGFDWHRSGTMELPGVNFYGLGVVRSIDGGQTWMKTSLSFNPSDQQCIKRLTKDESSVGAGTIYAIAADIKKIKQHY